MPGGYLNLTFHGPGTIAEDLLFKQKAKDEKLIAFDAMDNAGPPANDLMTLAAEGSGLRKVTSGNASLISFGNVGAAAWTKRQAFRQTNGANSVLDGWMRDVLKHPVECLVLAGHHSGRHVWGLEAGHLKPYTAFVADAANKEISVRGHAANGVGDMFKRAGPYKMTDALSECRLIMVWGCNGATNDPNEWTVWRELVKACNGGKTPLVLGHYFTHKWPRDRSGERFSGHFVTELRKLDASATIGALAATQPVKVITAWAQAMKAAFAASMHCNKHMLFQGKPHPTCEGYGPRGAGGVNGNDVHYVVDETGRLEIQN
jgi:hypothetical protein